MKSEEGAVGRERETYHGAIAHDDEPVVVRSSSLLHHLAETSVGKNKMCVAENAASAHFSSAFLF